MSRVTKSNDFEVYHVRAGYQDLEWATIAIKGWQAKGNDDRPREIGEILIHSSYGSWAYQWGHLGVPFKAWLAKTDDKHYIAGKFLADKAYKFDGEKTVKGLRERVIEWRKVGDLEKEQARLIWDWIEENELELETSVDSFVNRMYDGPRDCDDMTRSTGARFFEEPWEYTATSLDRQFDGFWTHVWPAFQQALREELNPTTTQDHAHT